MKPLFERVAVLGLGLLGGSVALAARRRGVAGTLVGAARREETRREALRLGAVDAVEDWQAAVRGAELVVLATPLHAMAGVLERAVPGLAPGALVTDVGSVKARLAETLPGLLPAGACYVGAHPMAGSHASGLAHADADLFQGAACAVMRDAPPTARERVASFWRALGARVVWREPAAHDAEVAWVSHLPHLLAFAYGDALSDAPAGWHELRGAGFRDFTRIAHSDAELWSDILGGNRKALAAPLQAVAQRLLALGRVLEGEDAEALLRLLGGARETLARGALRGTQPADSPEPPTASGPGGVKEEENR